jgi:hypothetical protein
LNLFRDVPAASPLEQSQHHQNQDAEQEQQKQPGARRNHAKVCILLEEQIKAIARGHAISQASWLERAIWWSSTLTLSWIHPGDASFSHRA